MLGAFFIATDPVSSPATGRGRLAYGTGIGVLTYLIRTLGSYPDGVAFAVLLMNLAVPLIDRWTRPRVYGRSP
jgi:electron transport complex protein RnfD